MEKKLELTTCSNEECVGVTTHQLTGAARVWWDSYCDTHANPMHIPWEEFAETFREHHVPKVEEFHNISQWSQIYRSTPTASLT
jgi:hypothetical protein